METRGAQFPVAKGSLPLPAIKAKRSSFLSRNCSETPLVFVDEVENLCDVVEIWGALSSLARREVSSIFPRIRDLSSRRKFSSLTKSNLEEALFLLSNTK